MIDRRLALVGKIIAVSSGKGGVGKSVTATALALILTSKGNRVGLLDLDFTSPSTHLILGVEGLQPTEDKGIRPPLVHRISYMSIVFYSVDKPAPLRGVDISDAIIELLAITRWGELDYLVIDMPPGISDATLDIIRLVKGIEFIVVTTPSKVAYETVKKQLELLKQLHVSILGVIENMVMHQSTWIMKSVESEDVAYLGAVRYDPRLEEAIGKVKKLKETKFFKTLQENFEKLG